MDTNNKQFLPQYTLDQLQQRVCSRLLFIAQYNTWEGVPELCMRIEAEPRAVNSVILIAKRQYSGLVAPNIYKYHLGLTRVYILLYYRHRDDQIYQAIVFPELIKYISNYIGDALKNVIQPEINKILEQDQLVEKVKAEKKKNIKPLYAYVNLSGIEMDHLFNEYNAERLFQEMTEKIKELSKKHKTNQDEVEVWHNAKRVVHTLRDIPRPEFCIARAALALVNGQLHNGYIGSQIILLCVYAMVRSAQDNPHFAKFINAMEELEYKVTDLEVIQANIGEIKTNLDLYTPFDDYDYIGDMPTPTTDVFTKADMEQIVSDYKAKVEELEKQLAQKDKAMEELKMKQEVEEEDGEVEDRKDNDKVLYNKVCYEFFLQLLENAGLNINNTNKTDIGKLWEMFTGKAGNDIRKFSSKRNYKNNHTNKDIKTLNEHLEVMKITNVKL